MNIRFPEPGILVDAYDLQRQFAAHMLLLRGFARDTRVEGPPGESFDLVETSVTAGDVIHVADPFTSPPLLAYVDDVPARLNAAYNQDTGRASISLIAPRGTLGGPVRLVWPEKTLVSTRPVWIAGHGLDLRQQEVQASGDLIVGLFDERPIEVHIGMKQLPPDAITWENHLLQVRVPLDASGQVLVVTRNRVYRSAKTCTPSQRKKTTP